MSHPSSTKLWALADARAAPAGAAPSQWSFRWVIGAAPCLALIVALAVAVMLPGGLPGPGRAALFCFGVTVILWTLTSFNATYVALAGVVLLILTGGAEEEELFEALESNVIWLMIGAFILGGAIQSVGLAARLTRFIASHAKTTGQLFWLMTSALWPLAFLIPSTSGRAAVALPIFQSLSASLSRPATRALALLIPTIILVTTVVSLIGAGSHLIANDLLNRIADQRISFSQWLLWGLPFGLVAGYAACFMVLRLFLSPAERMKPLSVTKTETLPFTGREWTTLAITVGMLAGWLADPWHHFEIATISVIGALALTAPKIGVLNWREGVKAVSWDLIVFVGAALVMGEALVDTGAAGWIVDKLFAASGLREARSSLLALAGLSLITLTAHIYMTSHAARAAALIPPLLYLAGPIGLNPVAVMFIATVGMNYCLTFPVSSKALLVFYEIDADTFHATDLLRLSAILIIMHVALIVAFYYGYWQWVGLAL